MNEELESVVSGLIVPHAAAIAGVFYEEMVKEPQGALFLESELVDRRLRASMTAWLEETFSALGPEAGAALATRHADVGLVHARIKVPMRLVTRGLGVLKRECCERLRASELERGRLVEAILLVNETLDNAGALINESYLTHALDYERTDQSLRLHVISQNLAIECERLRSGLFDWMRKSLVVLYSGGASGNGRSPLRQSELGLWVAHKAELLFPDLPETADLKAQVGVIDAAFERARETRVRGLGREFEQSVGELDEVVGRAAWLLSALVEHALETERSRDPLTRVLSRRYLPSILQREVKLSLEGGVPFSVLLLDIDGFKEINDAMGHAVGDEILSGVGEILMGVLRANDFVFRYGGDEFLALLGHTTREVARGVAERIRHRVERHDFVSLQKGQPPVTVSIGVAAHEGHPDYSHVVERADRALMQAKKKGRNRCAVASVTFA